MQKEKVWLDSTLKKLVNINYKVRSRGKLAPSRRLRWKIKCFAILDDPV